MSLLQILELDVLVRCNCCEFLITLVLNLLQLLKLNIQQGNSKSSSILLNGNMQARHLQQNQSLESLDKIEKSLFDSVVHFKWTHSLQ